MASKQRKRGASLAEAIIKEYNPKTVGDMQSALKEVFGPLFEAMLNGEMENHLGYGNNDRGGKETTNRRNGYTHKTLKTSIGEVPIDVPRDRDGSFEPQVVPKRQTDVSSIEGKVLSMYARGMSQRDISATIDDIYGFKLSPEQISNITDSVLGELEEWQNRPLKAFYPFVFVDCIYVSMRTDHGVSDQAVYVMLGYDLKGEKDVLGLWMGETESKHRWMQIFDEIKARGIQDIGFISMDGVSGLEDGAKAVFKGVVVQRCIVHLIRNSLKYVPSKDYKAFTGQLKKIYGAVSLKAAQAEFERFCEAWSKYPGAVRVWKDNFRHVEQLFNYGSEVRRVMYTTNAIESVNSSFRKVTKKGSFSSETAVFKIFYLRIKELYKKWQGHSIRNWAMVMNQLVIDERIGAMVSKYQATM